MSVKKWRIGLLATAYANIEKIIYTYLYRKKNTEEDSWNEVVHVKNVSKKFRIRNSQNNLINIIYSIAISRIL